MGKAQQKSRLDDARENLQLVLDTVNVARRMIDHHNNDEVGPVIAEQALAPCTDALVDIQWVADDV